MRTTSLQPRVYLRGAQNAVDAVAAGVEEEPDAPRRVRVEPPRRVSRRCLRVEDTGIGLDEAGVRGVLATIGAWTKRDALGLGREKLPRPVRHRAAVLLPRRRRDPGRRRRRARRDETWLWIGRDDGTYACRRQPSGARAGRRRRHRRVAAPRTCSTSSVVERLATSFAAYCGSTWSSRPRRPGAVAGQAFPGMRARTRLRAATSRWCEACSASPRSTSSTSPTPQPACADRPSCSRTPRLPAAPTGSTRSGCWWASGARCAARVGLLRAGRARRRRAGADGSRESLHDDEALHETRARSASSSSAGC